MQQNQPTHHHISWRAAAILKDNTQPIFGHAMEITESSVVISFEKAFPNGLECRVYLDVPDPNSGRPVYLDFRIRVQESSLMGKVSLFRHIMKIIDIKPEQQAFLKRILKH